MKKLCKVKALILLALILSMHAFAQQDAKIISITFWDGMVAGGYVNDGGFVNFGGPAIKLVRKPWSFGFGILPTMRIKKEQVPKEGTKNSAITPTAGFGFTFAYRHLVLQIPFYYNSKTVTSNGKWHPGIGLGYKF